MSLREMRRVEEVQHMTNDLKAPETDDIKLRLRGRAAHLYDRGEIKSPSIMIEAADRIATLEAALADMTQQRDRQYDENVSLIAKQAATETERDAAMAGAVKIKPLIWDETHEDRGDGSSEHNGGYEADSAFGVYEIGMGFESDIYYWSVQDEVGNEIGNFDDPDIAKAAAQAAHESRVLSALTPDTDRMLALTAAAYEDAATITSRHKRYWEDAAADIRARIPANAIAALSRIEAQAEARGMRICADIYYTRCCADDDGDDVYREMMSSADATEAAAKGGV